jgi:hypothetical protein
MRLGTRLTDEGSKQDAMLDQALRDFRSSAHAWSEAEYGRPHHPERVVRLTSWRVAAGWALGCVLATGTVTGGMMEYHHRQDVARAAAAEAARQQKLQAEERAVKENDDLLAKVDNDVSRQVPKAMEPLAQLMAEDEAQ